MDFKRDYSDFVNMGFANAMAKEARLSKLWINYGKRWFAPDEFIDYVASKMENGHANIKCEDIKLKDPIAAVARMRQVLDAQEKKLSDFAIKIADYYRGSAKGG